MATVEPVDVPNTGNDRDDERLQRLASGASARKEGWKQTNEEMHLLADERRADGFDVVTVTTVHTDTVTPDMGDDTERFGFVHVVPDNHADAVVDALDDLDVTRYEAYRSTVDNNAFLVVELLDESASRALLFASYYDPTEATAMIDAARERGVLYTHLKRIDGTHLGTIRHEAFEPLIGSNG